jgi:hypothetical protein
MNADALSFSSTAAPDAKSTAPFVTHGRGHYRKPIVVARPDHERNYLANNWTWNNLLNGTNNLANPNPYGNGFAFKYEWY